MADREAFEKAFDMILDDALDTVNTKEGEARSSATDIHFSAEHEKKMKQLFRKLQREDMTVKIIAYGKRAACVLLVAIVMLGVSVCSVDAWRVKVLNFFYDADAPNSDYNFSELGGTSYSEGDINLAYLPWGFELTKRASGTHDTKLKFENQEMYFVVSVEHLTGKGSIDTEDAVITSVDINGCEALLIEKEDYCHILWRDDENSFYIMGNLNPAEIVKIAKNLKKS